MNCKYCNKEINHKGNLTSHEKTCEKVYLYKDEILRLYTEEFLSTHILCEKFKIGAVVMTNIILKDVLRTSKESNKIFNKLHPNHLKHTDEAKEKIRQARFEYMKTHKVDWIREASYSEKIFYNKLIELGYDKKHLIIRESSFYPYFIDFAFENEKLAIEVDGSQHLREEQKLSDERKDKLLNENGWSVIRFTSNEVNRNIDNVFNVIDEKLKKLEVVNILKVGIMLYEKKVLKKERDENNQTEKQKEQYYNQRKVKNRPTLQQLKLDVDELGYSGTGRKYGVSDTAIVKWINQYENKLILNDDSIPVIHNDIEKYKIIREKKVKSENEKIQYNKRKFEDRPSLDELEKNIKEFGYKFACEIYKIKISTIYKWVQDYKK